MNPLRVAAGVVSLLSELVSREYRRVQFPYWPDGEAPLIDGSLPEVWATMPQQSSAGSASEARVDPTAESPTPGRAHTPGVGQPDYTPAGQGREKLLRASASQLYAYAIHVACPAAIYVTSLADQLHDAANSMDSSK